MLIVCSGPDTYRAREKAKELQAAFRIKHDPQGLASEVIDGSLGISALLSRLAGASLFSPKKFIRADGCLAKMKIADVRTLSARLERDKDQTIVLTVEESAPAVKVLETLKPSPLFHYAFEFQRGAAFSEWVCQQAEKMGVSRTVAAKVSASVEGDSWLAMQELAKQAVYSSESVPDRDLQDDFSAFDVADMVLAQSAAWRRILHDYEDDGVLSLALHQARSYMRIHSGVEDGLHPYVVKKLKNMRIKEPDRCGQIFKAFIASRTGLAGGDEIETLL